MRDFVAGLVAIALLVAAASLGTTLTAYRRRRRRARELDRTLGRTIIAELPTPDDLVIVSEDAERFYYGDRSIDKTAIVAVRLLINGAPLAVYAPGRRANDAQAVDPEVDQSIAAPEGIARDRWDVAIETTEGTTRIECGAVRERVSQELARAVFDAVKRTLRT